MLTLSFSKQGSNITSSLCHVLENLIPPQNLLIISTLEYKDTISSVNKFGFLRHCYLGCKSKDCDIFTLGRIEDFSPSLSSPLLL